MAITPVLLPVLVALVGIFLAWSPDPSWEKEHFSDEAFQWPASLQYRDVAAQGLTMKTVVAGNGSRGVVVFVHGFPETAQSWREYLLHYEAQGYQVLAPDMRNVNNSVADSGHGTLDLLADDILAVVKSTGREKAVVVGHDWGAMAAWCFTLKYPEHTEALVSLAVPHPELYRLHNLQRLPWSLGDVWYFFFWGLTGQLARWKVAKDDFAWFSHFALRNSEPKSFSHGEVAQLKEAWRRRMTSETSPLTFWYSIGAMWVMKSLLPSFLQEPALVNSIWSDGAIPSRAPTLQLFGGRDKFINAGMYGYAAAKAYVAHPLTRTMMLDASHWLNHERKQEIMKEMDSFLALL